LEEAIAAHAAAEENSKSAASISNEWHFLALGLSADLSELVAYQQFFSRPAPQLLYGVFRKLTFRSRKWMYSQLHNPMMLPN
jgi:hypothetical protein